MSFIIHSHSKAWNFQVLSIAPWNSGLIFRKLTCCVIFESIKLIEAGDRDQAEIEIKLIIFKPKMQISNFLTYLVDFEANSWYYRNSAGTSFRRNCLSYGNEMVTPENPYSDNLVPHWKIPIYMPAKLKKVLNHT